MSLITRCPKCQSGFEVTSDQLRLHEGLVRCGQCAHVFDGFECLQAELPTLTRKVDTQASVSPKPNDVQRASSVDAVDPAIPPVRGRTEPDLRSGLSATSSFHSSPASSSTSSAAATGSGASASAAINEPRQSVADSDDPSPLVRRISAWAEPSMDKSLYPKVDASRSPAQGASNAMRAGAPDTSTADPLKTSVSSRSASPRVSGLVASSRDEREPVLSSVATRLAGSDELRASNTRPVRVMGEARLRGEDPSAAGRREPEFLEDEEPSAGLRVFWWGSASLLGLLLILQLAVFFRNDLATTLPMSRGVLESICQPLGCEVNYVRNIDRIVIIGSSLQQVEQTSGDESPFLLRLTLQNRSDYPQQWPSLLLSLSDASGTVIARKVVAPQTYLPVSMEAEPFGARQEVALEMPISVQGLAVSGFELQRFFP